MVATTRDAHAALWVGDDDPVTVTEDGRVVRPQAVAPPPPRRMPVRTATVELDGDYAGWRATVRTNAPFANFLRLSQLGAGDGQEMMAALGEVYALLPKLVMGWNFVDEDGAPLPCNAEGFAQLPGDLMLKLITAAGSAANMGADDPKG